MSEALLVITKPIPTPMELVPGSFVADLADAEAMVAKLVISDASTAQAAAYLQQRLTKAGTALEKARADLKAPLLVAGKLIDETAKGPALRIEACKTTLKRAQVAYDEEQRRIAAETEKKRQAEIRAAEEVRLKELKRLQDIADAEARENKRIADELAAKTPYIGPKDAEDDLDLADDTPPPIEKTETQKAIEALKYAPLPVAPAVVQPKTQGLAFRTTLKIASVDVNLLPETFVTKTANLVALRAVYTSPWKEGQVLPECPGVKFEVERNPITR